jgi:hypothetical protein
VIVREDSPEVSIKEGTAGNAHQTVDLSPPDAVKRRRRLADLLAVTSYIALAMTVFGPLWTNLSRGYMGNGLQDQNMFEWFFAVTANNLVHLENPLFSTLQNVPDGVNLMANTAMLGLGIPLAPITLVFGASVSWALALTGGLAGTAFAWYWVLSRHIVPSRVAACVGGGFCAFAPPIISHANAHPNFVALFMIPLIVLRLIRLAESGRAVRDGVILGLLVAYQIFIGEEPLLIAAATIAVFGIAYICIRPAAARAAAGRFLAGVGLGAVVCLMVVGYPLWFQFFGPQAYHSLEHGSIGNDVAALTAFASDSVGGNSAVAGALSINPTEENAFFGWPLIVLVVVIAIWLWRMAAARAAAITVFVMAVLSMGRELKIDGWNTGISLPWELIADAPLFETVIESRMAIGCVPVIGVLLALASDRAVALAAVARGEGAASDGDKEKLTTQMPLRLLWFGSLVAILLPAAPTPLSVVDRPETPRFFTDGTWRDFAKDGQSLVLVPLPSPNYARALRWQVDTNLGFSLAEGYFLGPNGPEQKGTYGAVVRPTSELLKKVAESGDVPQITDANREAAREDLRFWRASAVVLPEHPRKAELLVTLESLLGRPGERVSDVYLWDVNSLALTR